MTSRRAGGDPAGTTSRVGSAIASLAALVLLWAAVPLCGAAVRAAPAVSTLELIRNGADVGYEALGALVEALGGSLRMRSSAQARSDLALGQLVLAEQGRAGNADPVLVGQAIDNLRRSVLEAPARPFAWLRLAYAETLMGSPTAPAAFSMSVVTGSVEPLLLWPRLSLGLHLWPDLDAASRTWIRETMPTAWRDDPALLVQLADAAGQVALLDQALADDSEARAELERLRRTGD